MLAHITATQANEEQLQQMAAEYSKLAAEAAEKESNSKQAIGHLHQRQKELETVIDMQRKQISDLTAPSAVHGTQSASKSEPTFETKH